MGDFAIRKARYEDALAIAEVITRGWRTAYAHILPAEKLAAIDVESRGQRYSTRLASKDQIHFVSEYCDRVVGVVSMGVYADDPLITGDLFVSALYVDPSVHGRGIGRILLTQAKHEAHCNGFARLSLTTFVENQNARAFYKACGGTEYAQGRWHWEGGEYPVVYIAFEPEQLQ